MGGRETTRGILLQAVVCLLGALQSDENWSSLSLEPDLGSDSEADKIDIAWWYLDTIKATQVKSSQHQLNMPQVKQWAEELKGSRKANDYELLLIGPCSEEISKGQILDGVNVPSPKPLDIQGLVEQVAHRLAVYLEQRNKPAGKATIREKVAYGLVGELEKLSITEQKPILRGDFEKLLDGWVVAALTEADKPTLKRLAELETDMKAQLERIPDISTLYFTHRKDELWRKTTRRCMLDLDLIVPGNNYAGQYDLIGWSPVEGIEDPTTDEQRKIYNKHLNNAGALLEDGLKALARKIEEVR